MSRSHTSWVVDLIDLSLLVHRQAGNQLGDALWGEKLSARLAGIGEGSWRSKLIGVAKEVDLIILKVAKIELFYPLEYGELLVFPFTVPPWSLLLRWCRSRQRVL